LKVFFARHPDDAGQEFPPQPAPLPLIRNQHRDLGLAAANRNETAYAQDFMLTGLGIFTIDDQGKSAIVAAEADADQALVLDAPFDAHGSPLWAQGAYMPQSRAAMLVSRVVDPQPGERVLDLCAAPGGKSTHLSALMDGGGEILAVERNPRRAGTLARTAERLHAPNVRVEVADAALSRAALWRG